MDDSLDFDALAAISATATAERSQQATPSFVSSSIDLSSSTLNGQEENHLRSLIDEYSDIFSHSVIIDSRFI